MDSNGLADPYVKLHLLPGASKVQQVQHAVDCYWHGATANSSNPNNSTLASPGTKDDRIQFASICTSGITKRAGLLCIFYLDVQKNMTGLHTEDISTFCLKGFFYCVLFLRSLSGRKVETSSNYTQTRVWPSTESDKLRPVFFQRCCSSHLGCNQCCFL